MATQETATASETAAYTGKADNYVPIFSNVQRDYKEYRKRVEIYATKMTLANRARETVFNLVTLMNGRAWDLVEDLTVEDMQKPEALQELLRRLDRGFKFDPLTELPDDFEAYFVKMQRKSGQTLQEWAADYLRAERRLRQTHSVELPEKVRAWLFLRRSGISKEQRQLVLTNVGVDNLNLDAITRAMNFILGQDSRLDMTSKWAKRDIMYYQDEEEMGEDEWDDGGDPAYYQEADDEPPWIDADQAYYEEEMSESYADEIFDVEEFDSIYAAYADAKQRLNQMRTARGFYPVVALVNGPPQKGSPSRSPSSRSKGGRKGKGKSKKGNGKGKGQSQSPLSPKGAKAPGRAAMNVGRQICLRCGQSGHWARDCPTGGEKKRKVEPVEDEVMMVQDHADVFAMDNEDYETDYELCTTAVQDGGAASVLGSITYVQRYLRYLMVNGYDMGNLEVYRCRKGFRYGNSETEMTDLCILLPVVLGNRKMKVLAYITKGKCPILMGRPLLERLGLTVDYAEGKMRWNQGPWRSIPRGHRGEHLLDLVEDMPKLLSDDPFSEELMPVDYEDHIDLTENLSINAITNEPQLPQVNNGDEIAIMDNALTNKDDEPDDMIMDQGALAKETMTEAEHPVDHLRPPKLGLRFEEGTDQLASPELVVQINDKGYSTRGLPRGKLHGMIAGANKAAKEVKQMLKRASQVSLEGKKVIWEVFAGKGRTTQCLQDAGVIAERFSLADGWDFTKGKDRKRFLHRLEQEEPDEVLISPECKLWSPLQELSLATHPERKQVLFENRRRNHDEVLMFCAVIYEVQRRGNRHCHVEHPWGSRAWKTKAFNKMTGHSTYVDQCMYGLKLPDEKGVLKHAKKPTCFRTTKRRFKQEVECCCSGDHEHVAIEGSVPGQGPRSRLAENYPTALAEKLADAMIKDEIWDHDFVLVERDDGQGPPELDGQGNQQSVEEDREPVNRNKLLRTKVGAAAFNYVARLHKNLGHPSGEVLQRMLEEVQASGNVLQAAKEYICPTCYMRKKPASVPPASGLTARHFGDRLLADSAWVDTKEGRVCILTMMDQATRYVTLRVLASEQSKDLIKGLERGWIKHFGQPKILRIDEAKGWSAELLRNWASDHGITVEIAPAETHSWLGAVERKHQVVRRALELYMAEMGEATKKNLLEACIYVPGQVNNLSMVRGFSPAQWVLGKGPMDSYSLSGDVFNPAAPDLGDVGEYAEVQQRRLRAQTAFLKADTDYKLRRAMNRTYREGDYGTPVVGQRVFFWRLQGTGILQKNKWRGPARVVAVEHDGQQRPLVLWLAHGTTLLRCGPHQVKPVVQDAGTQVAADPQAALRDLQDLKARSTTQYRDIVTEANLEDNFPDDTMESDPILVPEGHESDADDETMPPVLPGAVQLAYGQLQRLRDEQRPPTRQRSVQEPEPEAPEPLEKRPRVLSPSSRDALVSNSATTAPRPNYSYGGSASSSQMMPPPPQPPQQRPAPRAEQIPVPEDDDSELYVDVHMVEAAGDGLPEGWTIVDGDIELDQVWLSRQEAREKDMNLEERTKMIEAKKQELSSYFANFVWEFCDQDESKDEPVVSARWVLTWKEGEKPEDAPKAKARLVLRGFQDPDLLTIEKAAPTATKQAKLIVLTLAGNFGWTVYCGDVKTAFLSGSTFNRKVIVKLPNDCGPLLGYNRGPLTMRMLKSAYGLADAPLLWWKEADKRLTKNFWRRHPLDRCFYGFYSKDGSLCGCLVLHVDDLLVAGLENHQEFAKAIKDLRSAFNFGKWKKLVEGHPLMYCGGQLSLTKDGIHLSYEDYIKRVMPVTLPRDRDLRQRLNAKEVSKARGLIGALQWPAGQGFPGLSASISILAADIEKADGHLIQDLNKSLKFAKQNSEFKLTYGKIADDLSESCMVAFSDAAFAVRSDHSSQGGYLLVLTNKKVLDGQATAYSVLGWRSHKLQRVCRSSLAAESQASASAVDDLMMTKTMLSLLCDPTQDPRSDRTAQRFGQNVLVIDAKALYDALMKPNFVSAQDKRTAIEVACVQDEARRLQLIVRWVSSERMFADGLTKLAARQSVMDMMRSGKMSISYDKDFVAAKKKTMAERIKAQKKSGGDYGSRVARQISHILAIQNVAATEGVEIRFNDGATITVSTGFLNFDLYDLISWAVLLFFVLSVLYFIYGMIEKVVRRTSTTSSTSTSSSAATPSFTTTTCGTQTFELNQSTEIRLLNQMLRDRDSRVENLENLEVELRGEIRGLRRQLDELRQAARLSAPVLPQQPQLGQVFHTERGDRYHIYQDCGHIRDRVFKRRQVCLDCLRRAP